MAAIAGTYGSADYGRLLIRSLSRGQSTPKYRRKTFFLAGGPRLVWIAPYDVLEARGFQMCLANARHTRNLPGRKSDVQESQWLLKLHTYDLLLNSFHPPDEIRALRSVWQLRNRHVKEAARTLQHMQKSMIAMNVQLSNTISDLSGMTGLAIIRAILAGGRDPKKLAKLRDWRIKATEEEIARSLEGDWREDMLFELRQAVDAYDLTQKQIVECDQRLQALLADLPAREVGRSLSRGRRHPTGRQQEEIQTE